MKTYHIRRARVLYDPTHAREAFWQTAEIAEVNTFPWYKGGEQWEAFAQLLYDGSHLYFRMVTSEDHAIRGIYTEPNQAVHKDSCAELFVMPGTTLETGYFNYEINCVGTLHLAYGRGRSGRQFVRPEWTELVRIWHSIPGPQKEEQPDDCCWEVEAAIPFAVMQAYVDFPLPQPGTEWRGNFYRCADDTSNPQWSVWNPIPLPQPDYHRPEFFGRFLFI